MTVISHQADIRYRATGLLSSEGGFIDTEFAAEVWVDGVVLDTDGAQWLLDTIGELLDEVERLRGTGIAGLADPGAPR